MSRCPCTHFYFALTLSTDYISKCNEHKTKWNECTTFTFIAKLKLLSSHSKAKIYWYGNQRDSWPTVNLKKHNL